MIALSPRRRDARRLAGWLLAILIQGIAAVAAAQGAVTYDDIGPVLSARCTLCHSGPNAPLGLRLDSLEGVMAGSANGPVLVPGDPNGSEIIRRLRGESLPRMPLTGPPFLSDEEIDIFVSWIAGGAPAGAGQAAAQPAPVEETPGPAEPPPTDAPTAEAPPAAAGPPTYADVQPLLLQRCAVCHTTQGAMGPPPEGYRLDTYEETVGVADRARVVPFEPAASELVRKVLGQSQPRMPFGGPYLDQVDIDLIVAWVANGARDANGVPAEVPAGTRVRLQGAWGAGNTLDGLSLVVTGDTRFDDRLSPGDQVEVRGFVDANGRVVAERIRLE